MSLLKVKEICTTSVGKAGGLNRHPFANMLAVKCLENIIFLAELKIDTVVGIGAVGKVTDSPPFHSFCEQGLVTALHVF